jgi:hypothetical protein
MNKFTRFLCLVALLSLISLACSVNLPKTGEDSNVQPTPKKTAAATQPTKTVKPTVKPKPTATEEVVATPTEEFVSESIKQWASSAEASSQYGDPSWAAIQAIGAPDVEECGDNISAWASEDPYSPSEWLEVYYDTPVIPTEITIHISYNPSQVTEVGVIDLNGEYTQLIAEDPAMIEFCPDWMTISVTTVDFPIHGVRIILDQSVLQMGWTEIDAVELVGTTVEGYGSGPGVVVEGNGGPGSLVGGDTGSVGSLNPNSLDPGMFYYEVTGAETAIISNNQTQDQSVPQTVVVGLISADFRYSLSLFLPYNLQAGTYDLKGYEVAMNDPSPSTTLFAGVWMYYSEDGGTLDVYEVKNGLVTATFAFDAYSKDKPTDKIHVVGAMKEVKLIP